ncbi:hypothetical protein ABZT34_03445 [Streptomyces sp. NPDC005329]
MTVIPRSAVRARLAIVCTPGPNVGAVATYESAGSRRLPEIRDLYRDA